MDLTVPEVLQTSQGGPTPRGKRKFLSLPYQREVTVGENEVQLAFALGRDLALDDLSQVECLSRYTHIYAHRMISCTPVQIKLTAGRTQ